MIVYYFTMIAVGLMFLLNIAGIPTGTSQILNLIGGTGTGITTSSFFVALGVFFAAVAAITIVSTIFLGQYPAQAALTATIATFLAGIYLLFVNDLISIVRLIGESTNNTGWAYWLAWLIIIPAVVGYSLSLIKFIQGTD